MHRLVYEQALDESNKKIYYSLEDQGCFQRLKEKDGRRDDDQQRRRVSTPHHFFKELERTVSYEDHGGGHRSLGVTSDVRRDHDQTESKSDGLAVDEPEPDQPWPSLREREEGHHARSQDTDDVSDGDLQKKGVKGS